MATPTTGEAQASATMPGYKFIQFDTTNYVARLTLNHAPHNVLTIPMMKEMAEAIESLNGRADVKAILLQSSQPAFSAGISLEDSRPDRVFQTLDAFTRVFQAMVDISKTRWRSGQCADIMRRRGVDGAATRFARGRPA